MKKSSQSKNKKAGDKFVAVLVDPDKPEWAGLYIRGDAYSFLRTVKGERIYEQFGHSRRTATQAAEELNYHIKENPDAVVQKYKEIRERQKWTVEYALNEYCKTHIKIKAETQRLYKNRRDTFLYWCNQNGIQHIKDITMYSIKDFFLDRESKPIVAEKDLPKGTRVSCHNGAAGDTLHNEKTYLKGFFKFLIQKSITKNNPVADAVDQKLIEISRPKRNIDDVEKRAFTREEITKMLLAAESINSTLRTFGNCTWSEILKFYIVSGLRENELINLQWTDIQFNEKAGGLCLDIGKKITEEHKEVKSEKGKKLILDRIKEFDKEKKIFRDEELTMEFMKCLPVQDKSELLLVHHKDITMLGEAIYITIRKSWEPKATCGKLPISKSMQEIINIIGSRSKKIGFMFQHKDGGRIRTKLLPIFHKTVRIAGILDYVDALGNIRKLDTRKLNLHSCRHTCAVMLRDQGVPLESIMGILRHANIQETQVYAPYNIKEGKTALDNLDF